MITTVRQQGMTVSTYYTKRRSIWVEIRSTSQILICTCQGCKCNINKEIANLRDKEQLYDFLMGLNEEFNVFKI